MSHIENMHDMLECLVDKAKATLDSGIDAVDTHEFGEVVDAIKDLNDSIYRATIVKAMKDAEEEDEKAEEFARLSGDSDRMYYGGRKHSSMRYYGTPYYRDPQRTGYIPDTYRDERMYYTENSSATMPRNGTSMSRYDTARRNYTETRDAHKGNTTDDKEAKMHELENYLNEISSDISELVSNMTPEEKNLARSRINVLATKIV